ncbi:unnamed protein product [Pleuronectes platessa]|uniref:Uncharacterized protein n=1 Tax=Pleuronectes platessa TaxID=8262 RepID=A0A9N7ZEW8_PLEPL|nr:unnamed protein product [Pleuronectes platessa]
MTRFERRTEEVLSCSCSPGLLIVTIWISLTPERFERCSLSLIGSDHRSPSQHGHDFQSAHFSSLSVCPAPGLQESARSEERSTNTLILFGQAFVWDTSKPKQPGEAPQQGRERGSNVPQDVQTETEKKKMVMMMMAAYL